jgi:UPF0755 protein
MATRRQKIVHFLLVSAALGALALIDITAYVYYYYYAPGPLAEQTTVLFVRGKGFREIVDDLAEHDVIRYPIVFKAIAVVLGDARKFNAGEYHFSAAISPRLVMDMIAEGRVVVHKLTIPEGLRVDQVAALLDDQKLLEGKVADDIKEGSLLPQTYHYVYGNGRQELILRMQAGMETTLAELWEKRQKDLPIETPAEAVTLASIVERETSLSSERGRVAAVYINRLRKKMKLQADPTVIYGIEKEHGPLKRALLLSDLKYDSHYNTYKYEGLPPGPIANPGRDAIEAVLNPPKTNDIYFVATGTGGHNFSATLKGHSENIKAYKKQLQMQKEKPVSQPVPVSEAAPPAAKTDAPPVTPATP